MDGFIVSWWGQGTFEDQAIPRILDGCQKAGLQATIYYESVPKPKNADGAATATQKPLLKQRESHRRRRLPVRHAIRRSRRTARLNARRPEADRLSAPASRGDSP